MAPIRNRSWPRSSISCCRMLAGSAFVWPPAFITALSPLTTMTCSPNGVLNFWNIWFGGAMTTCCLSATCWPLKSIEMSNVAS